MMQRIACLVFFVAIGFVCCRSSEAQLERPKLDEYQTNLPWDFRPYKVLIWIAGQNDAEVSEYLKPELLDYLDRDYEALWRPDVVVAPSSLSILANRSFESINYEVLVADDPVIVMKRDHVNAARIRYPADVATHIGKILVDQEYAEPVKARGAVVENANLHGMVEKFTSVTEGLASLPKLWESPETEAMLVPRGVALLLEPKPKLVELNISARMGSLFDQYDKLFVVQIGQELDRFPIQVREIDCLMRFSGPVVRDVASDRSELPTLVGSSITKAFAPMVRLDEVGTKTVEGMVRGGGLIMDENSPCDFNPGDFLQPLMRKDDRNGDPMTVGIIDWTYLRATEKNNSQIKMEIHSGRAGALAGRRNSRTHRIAIKIRPVFDNTVLRLHLQGEPDQPLAGYDIFDREIDGKEFTKVGQTDWDGRLVIEKSEIPLRLLYVKNGLSVLARLPMVPGQTEMESADLVGDDIRLQAEAYIRGVQNSIIDLVAIRTLLASSIRRYLKQGDLARAQELLQKLREEPTYEKIANDMAQKQTTITSRNRSEQKKIDNMFGETRTLLVKYISPSLVRELDAEVVAAGGGPATAPSAAAAPSGGDVRAAPPESGADENPFGN